MALEKKFVMARSTADLPFEGLGVSLEACEEYAETLHVQVVTWTPAVVSEGMAVLEPPVALSGYRLLTVLGRETRGR